MNYYDARKLTDGSGYHYTRMNDGRIWPVGYCSHLQGCPECPSGFGRDGCEKCGGRGYIDLGEDYEREHVHATEEEARECFARYLLDGWREENYGGWSGCDWPLDTDGTKCDKPTKKGLTTRPPLGIGFPLCDEHRTFEHLKQLAGTTVGQITASY